MSELLLEIGTEEIPSNYLTSAVASLEQVAADVLTKYRLPFENIYVDGTPRRLVLHAGGMKSSQEALKRTVIGPPKRIAYDAEGKPTQAALGFAKSQNVSFDKVYVETKNKGEYLAVRIEEKRLKTKKILAEALPEIISSISFPKTMRWGAGAIRFVRPIHWIVALYGSEVVKFKVGDIKSGNTSNGHRFLAPREFKVINLKSYLDKSIKRYVIVDSKEREKMILKGANSLAASVKGSLIMDEGLLETTVNMTEYPFPILGGFEKKYLKLPKELLIEVIKKHQKCFTIADAKGRLLPYFVVVSNNRSNKPRLVRKGYEKVVRARFADAEYFYANDRSETLEHYNSKLTKVVWQDKLGTLAEKVERIKLLAFYIAKIVDPRLKDSAVRAAHLSKADLVSQVVYEFPELQGTMGRDYARSSKENKEVSEALFEQYLPRFAGDKLPSTKTGGILSIADKIDSIVGCFGVGLIPSGSEDPLALRRQSLAVMNIIIKKGWDISLSDIIAKSIEVYGNKLTRNNDEIQRDITSFFISRLKNQLTSTGLEYDVIDSVFAASFNHLTDDIKKVRAVTALKKESYFESLAVTFNRVGNILKGVSSTPEINPQLFSSDAEKGLYASLTNIEKKVAPLYKEGEYKGALKEVVAIREAVDLFFEGVMVMDKDEAVKGNRLALLKRVATLFSGIADFGKLVVK